MAGGIFVIQEYTAAGGVFTENPEGERFEWVASGRTQNGGAKAIPKKPWPMPGKQRIKRTDYPGARKASAQVLGPMHGPSTLQGRWDDKWNFAGYAVAEKRRFEAMCRRGNPVRLSFEEEVFDCIISDWEFEYQRASLIGYSFTIDNYGRPDEDDDRPAVVTAVLSADQAFDDSNTVAQALTDTHSGSPAAAMNGTSKRDIDAVLSTMSENLNKLADVLDTRTGVLKPIGEFKKTATMFRIIQGDASNVISSLVSARADLNLGVMTAMSVLDFEAWSRGMRSQARLLRWKTQTAATAMDERGQPKGIGYYYPRKGEHLYGISRRFYGTPFEWRLIADRNGLTALRLAGTERLIIPERGVG